MTKLATGIYIERKVFDVVVEQATSKKMSVSGTGTAMYVFNCVSILAQDEKVVERRGGFKAGKKKPR